MWRPKKPRVIELDVGQLSCHCFGPMDKCGEDLSTVTSTLLEQDELQSIIYQDIQQLTMDEASIKMWVSKTVYAGIYNSARRKLAEMLVHGSILKVCTRTRQT